jgi:hypothetical protein
MCTTTTAAADGGGGGDDDDTDTAMIIQTSFCSISISQFICS